MPLFCDQCGEEFGENALRANSKFCSYCGKALSDYVKQQCPSLFKSSPTASRFPGDGTPQSPSTAKKRNATEGDLHDGGSQLNDSMDDSPSKERSRPKTYSQVMIDENSTEEDPETEGAENQELGKGKRIRRSTQRYLDDVTATNSPTKRNRTSSNMTSIKKTNSSLEQILNSAPSSGQNSWYEEAAQAVPLSVAPFKLPPPLQPSLSGAGRPFRRDEIACLLGGSLKMTFPYPRNRRHGPTYACLKEAEQEYLPKRPGEHGIILVRSLPESLDTKGFTLFRKNRKTCVWVYLGKYKVVHSFPVSTAQWLALHEQTRKAKVAGTLRSLWGASWCEEKGIQASDLVMLDAFDAGILTWEAHVIECIEWDKSLFGRLAGT